MLKLRSRRDNWALSRCSESFFEYKVNSFTMKICAVQFQPTRGDITANLAKHLAFIRVAIDQGGDLIFFPELSLTGFEPKLAKLLATDENDPRFDVFQQCSNEHDLTIGVGLPLSKGSKVQIGMVWFTPNAARCRYAKQQLHADEVPFFVSGESQLILETPAHKLAPAICYESLQQNHADQAARLGANIYLASVAKSAGGMAKAMRHYPFIAHQYNMYVIMSNSLGPCDNFTSVGQSAVWNRRGELLVQMDSDSEGVLMVDTVTEKAAIHEWH